MECKAIAKQDKHLFRKGAALGGTLTHDTLLTIGIVQPAIKYFCVKGIALQQTALYCA